MWGTDAVDVETDTGARFIPTHVGNGQPAGHAGAWCAVHPHACGERVHPRRQRIADEAEAIGSSPRMWGTGPGFPCVFCWGRFIPTHVGNGSCAAGAGWQRAVHPHACGERPLGSPNTLTRSGSSPRMWGTGPGQAGKAGRNRFIPTHVGNGSPRASLWIPRPVHPHACGERNPIQIIAACFAGSSPRMWGTDPKARRSAGNGRFIPTHVGNGLIISICF